MQEEPEALTNTAAATRLRTLIAQLTDEPRPPLSTRLIKRLTPTPDEALLLSDPEGGKP
jgi:hypothetical protein